MFMKRPTGQMWKLIQFLSIEVCKHKLHGPYLKFFKGKPSNQGIGIIIAVSSLCTYQAFDSKIKKKEIQKFLFYYLLTIQNVIFKLRNNYANNQLRNHYFTYWQIQKLGSNVTGNLSIISMSPKVSALVCSISRWPMHSYITIQFGILKIRCFAY